VTALETLRRITFVVNHESFKLTGAPDKCFVTATALVMVLEHFGIPAESLRVETCCDPIGLRGKLQLSDDDKWRHDRRRRAPKDLQFVYRGHQVALAEGRYLLDPTLDQVPGLEPLAVEVTEAFLRGEQPIWWHDGTRYLESPKPRTGSEPPIASPEVRYIVLRGRDPSGHEEWYRTQENVHQVVRNAVALLEKSGVGLTARYPDGAMSPPGSPPTVLWPVYRPSALLSDRDQLLRERDAWRAMKAARRPESQAQSLALGEVGLISVLPSGESDT
jgi:hypothetical protein